MTTRSSKTSGAKTKTAKAATTKSAAPRKTPTPKAKTAAKPRTVKAKAPTTKPKTTASKAKAPTTKAKTTASKAKTAAPKAPVATVSKLEPVVTGPDYRKKDLLDSVAAKTGMKRSEVKKVVEATLFEMGAALQDSRDLNLQPFGVVKLQRERKLSEGRVLVTRIRQARDLTSEPGTEDVAAPATTKAAAE